MMTSSSFHPDLPWKLSVYEKEVTAANLEVVGGCRNGGGWLRFTRCENSPDYEAVATLHLKLNKELRLGKRWRQKYECQPFIRSVDNPSACPSAVLLRHIVHHAVRSVPPNESMIDVKVGVLKGYKESTLKDASNVVNVVRVQIRMNERVCQKLEEWVDASFRLVTRFYPGAWRVKEHPMNKDENVQEVSWDGWTIRKTNMITQFELALKVPHLSRWPSNYLDYFFNHNFVEFSINVSELQGRVQKPTYFVRSLPDPLFCEEGRQVLVKGEHGGDFYCSVAVLQKHSIVLSAQLDSRWDGNTLTEITIPGLRDEGIEALRQFLKFSHVRPATENFCVAVELLEVAHEYLLAELEDKLLDLMFIQPLENFTDVTSLITLYCFLRKTCANKSVLKRVSGVVKLKGMEIMEEFANFDPSIVHLLTECISTYDVVADPVSQWMDCHKQLADVKKYNCKRQQEVPTSLSWL